MTSAKGYRRLKPEAGRKRQAVWDYMRSVDEFTAADIVQATEIAPRTARHICTQLRNNDYIIHVGTACTAGFRAHFYRLRKNTGPIAPIFRKDGSVYDANLSTTTGIELRAWRQSLGWSISRMAAELGYKDGRTIRRYESLGYIPLPTERRFKALKENMKL